MYKGIKLTKVIITLRCVYLLGQKYFDLDMRSVTYPLQILQPMNQKTRQLTNEIIIIIVIMHAAGFTYHSLRVLLQRY